MLQQHRKDTTVAVENGHAIRVVYTRFGRLYIVDDIGARRTINGALPGFSCGCDDEIE